MYPVEVTNALTVDFEDWYQGLEIPEAEWGGLEDRLPRSGRHVLTLLAECGIRATFFVLGCVAERHPDLVREIVAAGHELGTHGWSHSPVYRLSPARFREELHRSVRVLEQVGGTKVIGHRAPFFSITRSSLWALEILSETGIRYDSSVFPVLNPRYGIEDAPRRPYPVPGLRSGLTEFPISTWRWLGRNLPLSGGAYFRIYPYSLTSAGFRRLNGTGQSGVFYLHPWELDPGHPRIRLPQRIALTHYINLQLTEERFRRLLREFRFAPMAEVLDAA